MSTPETSARLRALPSIDELMARPDIQSLLSHLSRPVAVSIVRAAVSDARARALAGLPNGFETRDVERQMLLQQSGTLQPVINASGVVLHTNLGRAPLAQQALERIAATASGYTAMGVGPSEAPVSGQRVMRAMEVPSGLVKASTTSTTRPSHVRRWWSPPTPTTRPSAAAAPSHGYARWVPRSWSWRAPTAAARIAI